MPVPKVTEQVTIIKNRIETAINSLPQCDEKFELKLLLNEYEKLLLKIKKGPKTPKSKEDIQ